MPRATVSNGKSWAACQITIGARINTPRAAPPTSHQLRKSVRGPTANRLPSHATTSSGTNHLFVMATPAVAPMANHQRPSPVRSSRATKNASTVQNSMSSVAVASMWVTPSTSPDNAVAPAASKLCATSPAELAGDERDGDHDRHPGQRRRDAQRRR